MAQKIIINIMFEFKYRMHKGGIYAWLKWIKLWVAYGFYAGLILLPFSIFMQFEADPIANVVCLKYKEQATSFGNYNLLGTNKDVIAIKSANGLDKLVFGVIDDEFLSFFNLIFYVLILFQLHLVFKKLEINKPFHPAIAKRLNYIGLILMSSTVIVFLRVWYMDSVVGNLTDHLYRLDYKVYLVHANEFKLGILILIIAYIYKYGCFLQQEQDLTI